MIDMTGWKMWEHGVPDSRITVLKRAETPHRTYANGKSIYFWECLCSCGTKFESDGNRIRSGRCKSCGCYQKEAASNKMKTHGMKGTRIYGIWRGIKDRCLNKNCTAYKNYGGRGITICDEWKDDFVSFYEWAINNGYEDNLTIDRINVNKNYCPENCRWATALEQGRNKRDNRYITYQGETKSLIEWSEITGVNPSTIRGRLIRGWAVDDALKNNIDKEKTRKNITFEHIVEYNGEKMNLTELSKLCGIQYQALLTRIVRYGWDVERAANTPIRRRRNNV